MIAKPKKLCATKVYRDSWGGFRCENRATDGEFCGVHSPAAVKKRQERKNVRLAAEERERKARIAELRSHPHTCGRCGLEHDPR